MNLANYYRLTYDPFNFDEEVLKHVKVQYKRYFFDGVQFKVCFDNDYVLSIINFDGSYGHEEGLYEVALMDKNFSLIFNEMFWEPIGYCNLTDINNIAKLVIEKKFDKSYKVECFKED